MLHSAAAAEESQGLDAALTLPESRGLIDHLGFPKIRVARETRSHRQSGEGWMTQLVSSSVSWLLSTFSDCVTTPAVESTLFIPLNVSFMTDVNQFKSLPQTHYKPSAESFKYTPFFLQHKVLRIQCGGVSFFDSLPLPTCETLSKSPGRSKYARPSNFCVVML